MVVKRTEEQYRLAARYQIIKALKAKNASAQEYKQALSNQQDIEKRITRIKQRDWQKSRLKRMAKALEARNETKADGRGGAH